MASPNDYLNPPEKRRLAEIATEIVRDIIWLPATKRTPGQIIAHVARRRGLTVQDLLGRSRVKRISYARQEAMWELRNRTQLSLPQIAQRFGHKDHTSVLHGVRAHEKRIAALQVGA